MTDRLALFTARAGAECSLASEELIAVARVPGNFLTQPTRWLESARRALALKLDFCDNKAFVPAAINIDLYFERTVRHIVTRLRQPLVRRRRPERIELIGTQFYLALFTHRALVAFKSQQKFRPGSPQPDLNAIGSEREITLVDLRVREFAQPLR